MDKNPRKISLIGSRATSVLSVSLVLIIVGLCATLGVAVQHASSEVSDGASLLITTMPGEDPMNVNDIGRFLNDAPWASDFEYIKADEVLNREVAAMNNEEREALELLSQNPFGDEFVVRIASGWRSSEKMPTITKQLRELSAVATVTGDSTDIGEVNDGMERVILYLSILALILLVISVALINNTISLSIYSRRFTIHAMKLVGATNSFIRRPFERAGMLTGAIAGMVATIVVCSIQCYLMFNDSLIGPWITPLTVLITGICLIVLGAVIARLAAWRAATVYLHKSYDMLFKR